MGYPLFTLGERLQLCASFVRPGTSLCDVGTDHGYLPIWLVKTGAVSRAIAADLREGPLQTARENVLKYQVGALVETRLSDGLSAVAPGEVQDIVVAGMGGDLIAKILREAPWVKDRGIHLILQPMSAAPALRAYLLENGFSVLREEAVFDEGRVYSAMLAAYGPGGAQTKEPAFLYAGLLRGREEAERAYLRKQLQALKKRQAGARLSHREEEARHCESAAAAIEQLLLEAEKEGL